jgi:pimeloyl-ACP methyl ester carboxylesterase
VSRAEPFTVHVEDGVLEDLRTRIRNTRWPDQLPDVTWEQGADLGYLRELLEHWGTEYDWRVQERELNRLHHFRASGIHFVHERARSGQGIPLVLTHGWPSTFVEQLPLVPLLTDPAAHGIDGPAFDVVIPSLPGYGFSDRPARGGATTRSTARLWHELMRGLGYERYGAQGGDFGASVTTFMALDEPEPLLGIHLHNIDDAPYTGPGSRPLSAAELEYRAQVEAWDAVERGYSSIQSTKPQTVGYGLNDSPAGLAAWILEKWRSWSDCGGDLERRFPRELLLANLTVYWVTQTITASMRTYYDMRWSGTGIGPEDRVRVPTGIAVFAGMLVPEGEPPREWAERLYDVRRWTPMPSGGHFAPAEEPERLARDIAAFFGGL